MWGMTAKTGVRLALAVGWLVASTAACDDDPTGPSDLIGGSWRLVSIDRSGLPSTAAPPGGRFSIEFLADNRLAARADCNSCGGTYELSGARFSIGPLACTRAFCGTDSLDTPFLAALTNARTISREGSDLTIRAEAVSLRFTQD